VPRTNIPALVVGFEQCPSPMTHIIIEHCHGTASRVAIAETACDLRVTGFDGHRLTVERSRWDRTGIAWARETCASLAPYMASTRYVTDLEDDAIDPAAVISWTEPAALSANHIEG
jgi:hypothetical protein